jgi:uncharacterized protein (DUF488 family)
MRIFTIGHSTRSFEEFLALLREFNVRVLADIRRYPSSRKFPQFNSTTLRELLGKADIDYMWFEALGGRRHGLPKDQSPNTLLRSPGFRNYADYMLTEEFSGAIHELLTAASDSTTAIMCAEKPYWKCHRKLVSDYLVAQGVRVEHILGPGDLRSHELTGGAVITEEKKVVYPSAQADQLEFGA